MSSLLAHIKIVEGQEQKFEELSKELYKQSHAKEDLSLIHISEPTRPY